MDKETLKGILDAHRKWLHGEDGGARANLTDADLTDADLTCADLTCANLTCADLTDADLTDADLTGANLTCADLTRADLTYADLTGANLTDADLTRADLRYVNTAGATFIFSISNIGSRNAQIVFWVKDGTLMVKTGCFDGDVARFLAAVESRHGNNKHGKAYRAAAELAKMRLLGE